jgi:RNA polymerase primary sigma factor
MSVETSYENEPLPEDYRRSINGAGASHSEADEALKAMLGLSTLPSQHMANGEPKEHQPQIAIGDDDAKAEFISRRLRMAYLVAEQHAAEAASAETSIEDLFQDAIEGILKGILGHQAGTIASVDLDKTTSNYMHKDVRRAVNRRGLVVDESYYKGRKSNKSDKKPVPNPDNLTSDPLLYYDADIVLGLKPEVTEKPKKVKKLKKEPDYGLLEYEKLEDIESHTETIASEDDTFSAVAEVLNVQALNAILSSDKIDERERQILGMHFGLDGQKPQTLDEIGRHFSITRERVRQIEHRTIYRIASLPQKNTIIHDEADNDAPEPNQNSRNYDHAMFLSRNRASTPDNSHRQTVAYRNEDLIEDEVTKYFDKLTGLISSYIVRVVNRYASTMQNGDLLFDYAEVKREVEDRYFRPNDFRLSDKYFDYAIDALKSKGVITDTEYHKDYDNPEYVETFSLTKIPVSVK